MSFHVDLGEGNGLMAGLARGCPEFSINRGPRKTILAACLNGLPKVRLALKAVCKARQGPF